MRRLYGLIFIFMCTLSANAQFTESFHTTFYDPDTLKRPFKALGLSLFPDATIYSINRYIKHSEFAYIDWHSTYDNFMFTSLWDNDMFGTNLLAHPFHGSLDYCGARVSGMNYWESFPYVFGASALWEFVLENEPASFNDQLATSFGGTILGESSFRLSSMIIKNDATGFERVIREIFGTLTCPMNGINRLITGEMWKKRHIRRPYPSEIIPVNFGFDLSARHLIRFDNHNEHSWSPYLHGWLIYGNPFRKENMRPLDYFRFDFSLDLSAKSAILSSLEVVGLLWGKQIETSALNKNLMWGVFQHFTYKEKEAFGSDSVPAMRYAEPASVGVGLAYAHKNTKNENYFRGSVHLNAVLLGGAHASYFKLKGREYNFGQGYSIKMNLNYNIKDKLMFGVNSTFTHLFTWKGYKKGIIVEEQDFRTLNAMGDKGNTIIGIFRPYFQWNILKHFALNLSGVLFTQHNHNCQFKNTSYYFMETNLGIKYTY